MSDGKKSGSRHSGHSRHPQNSRLFSLDVLRGFDMLLLLLIGPLTITLARGPLTGQFETKKPLTRLLEQMEHCTWDGFTLWDQIMPLFLFTAGAAVPYAMSRYKGAGGSRGHWRLWFRLIRRFCLLWILGAVLQGNLLSFKISELHIYCNPLQAIAVACLVSALLYLFFSTRVQIAVTALLLLGYWALERFIHFTPSDGLGEVGGGTYIYQHTLAEWVDRAVMTGHWIADGTQVWILPSLTFIVTAMTGVFAGTLTRNVRRHAAADEEQGEAEYPAETKVPAAHAGTFAKLLAVGAVLTAAGYAWSEIPDKTFGYCPLIKSVWTPSMTLLSSGISFLLFAFFYLITDLLKFRFGFGFLAVIGTNALLAYIFGTLNDGFFRENIQQLFFGLEPRLGSWYPVLLVAVNFFVIYFILWALHRNGKSLRA